MFEKTELFDMCEPARIAFRNKMESLGYKIAETSLDSYIPEMMAIKKRGVVFTLLQFLDPVTGIDLALTGKRSTGDVSTIFYYHLEDPIEHMAERFSLMLAVALERYKDVEISCEEREFF